jgi:hypothetical protein
MDMRRSIGPVRVAAAGLVCAGLVAIGAAATIDAAIGARPKAATESSVDTPATTFPAFADGEDARHAAEELLATYIESELGFPVTDAACSVPPTGDVGDEFVCYALKANELVVALRATVGPQRLIELDLLVNQTAPTTTETTETTAPPETSTG